jgi:protein-arginine kinase activator protein McsA
MKEAAKGLEFELAAILRDEIRELTARQKSSGEETKARSIRPAKKKK